MSLAVDICPERMDAADTEAPRPPRMETAVELCPGVAVESMEMVEEAVDICPERMEYSDFALQTDSAEGMGVETELEEATMLSLGTAVDAL